MTAEKQYRKRWRNVVYDTRKAKLILSWNERVNPEGPCGLWQAPDRRFFVTDPKNGIEVLKKGEAHQWATLAANAKARNWEGETDGGKPDGYAGFGSR